MNVMFTHEVILTVTSQLQMFYMVHVLHIFHNRNETLLTKLEFIRQAKDLGFLHNKDIFIDDKTIFAFELHPSCDKWNIRKIG